MVKSRKILWGGYAEEMGKTLNVCIIQVENLQGGTINCIKTHLKEILCQDCVW